MTGTERPAADGAEAATRDLGRAAARAAAALAAAATADDETAFACVLALDDAFKEFAGVLSVLPEILELAAPGRAVSTRLAQRRAELDAAQGELGRLRTELAAMGEAEQRLRETEAERDRLTARLAKLTEASERASQLPAIKEKLASLEAAVAATAADDADIMTRITGAVGQLTALTAEELATLGPQVERAVAEAAAAGETLARQRARLAQLDADRASLEAESATFPESFKHELDGLAKWRQADADLADALETAGAPATGPALDRLRGTLADLGSRLTDVDHRLRPLLEARTRAREEALRIRPHSTTPEPG